MSVHYITQIERRRITGTVKTAEKKTKHPVTQTKTREIVRRKDDYLKGQPDVGMVYDHVIAKRGTEELGMELTPQFVSRYRNKQKPKIISEYMRDRVLDPPCTIIIDGKEVLERSHMAVAHRKKYACAQPDIGRVADKIIAERYNREYNTDKMTSSMVGRYRCNAMIKSDYDHDCGTPRPIKPLGWQSVLLEQKWPR